MWEVRWEVETVHEADEGDLDSRAEKQGEDLLARHELLTDVFLLDLPRRGRK